MPERIRRGRHAGRNTVQRSVTEIHGMTTLRACLSVEERLPSGYLHGLVPRRASY